MITNIKMYSIVLLFCSILSFSLKAMDKPAIISDEDKARAALRAAAKVRFEKVSELKPISSKPFIKIPQYVFENCNQVTKHTVDPQRLAGLRKAVGIVTREKLKEKHTKEGVFNNQEYTATAEMYDWYNALNLLESNY